MCRKALMTVAALEWMLTLSACRQSSGDAVREAAKAGSWYPGSKRELTEAVDEYFRQAAIPALPGKVVGMVSPHAGYAYSGRAAAHGYKALKPGDYDVVAVIAPSHYASFRGASIADVQYYATPLGRIPLDRTVCDALLEEEFFSVVGYAHTREHSLELQLPFLQRRLGKFLLVPIVIGGLSREERFQIETMRLRLGQDKNAPDIRWPRVQELQAIGKAIKKHLAGRRVLYVASSDFTHYGRSFDYQPFHTDIKANLKALDGGAVDRIVAKDFSGFIDYRHGTGITVCGWQPIATLLTIADKNWQTKRLCYYTSGDMTGDWSHSVSYVSLVFTAPTETSDK